MKIHKISKVALILLGTISLQSANAMDDFNKTPGTNHPITNASMINAQNEAYFASLFTDCVTKNKSRIQLDAELKEAQSQLSISQERLALYPDNPKLQILCTQNLTNFNNTQTNYTVFYDELIKQFKQICEKENILHLWPSLENEDDIIEEKQPYIIPSETGECWILNCDFPQEIVTGNIVPFLGLTEFCRLRQTCQTFNITLGKWGIHYLNLAEVPTNITDENLAQCFTLYPMIKRLNVPSTFALLGRETVCFSGNNSTAFELAFKKLEGLEILEFNGKIKWSGKGSFRNAFKNFFVSFPNLANVKEFYLHDAPDDGKIDRSPEKMGDSITVTLSDIKRLYPNRPSDNLTTLSLPHCGLTSFGFSSAITLKNLTHLNLSGNKVGNDSAKWLVIALEKLPHNHECLPKLEVLDLSDSKEDISDEIKQRVKEKFGDIVKF